MPRDDAELNETSPLLLRSERQTVITSSSGESDDSPAGKCFIRRHWKHILRAFLIGSMILISQTLLQTWYAVAPSEFHSSVLLGFSNAFGELISF